MACLTEQKDPPSGARWSLSATPALEIGAGNSPPDATFETIGHAIRLRDGTVLVVDDGTPDVRLFDSTGAFLRRIGRRGQGPGEYRLPYRVGEGAGDTLLIYDFSEGPLGALLRYTKDGAPIDRRPVVSAPVGSGAIPRRIRRDGSMVLIATPRRVMASGDGRQSLLLMRYVPGDDTARVIAIIPRPLRSPAAVWAHTAAYAAGESVIYAGTSDRFAAAVLDTTGAVIDTIRRQWTPRRVTPADIERYNAEFQMRHGPSFRGTVARPIFPEAFPAFFAFEVDVFDNLWVQHPGLRSEPGKWSVFLPSGEEIADVEFPAGFFPLQIDTTRILGRQTDTDGVQSIRIYRLFRGT